MSCAWVSFLTAPMYLPGIVVLLSSLIRTRTAYPLVLGYTDGISDDAIAFLASLGGKHIVFKKIQGFYPTQDTHGHNFNSRFRDTWTKLLAFKMDDYETLVLLDADMIVRKNIDHLFSLTLPPNTIAAAHACTCNPCKISSYPAEWIPENCAHTYARGTVPISQERISEKPTFGLLNSGLVVLHPSAEVFKDMRDMVNTHPLVPTFRFPDQDLLALYFRGRWLPLGYQYNALKTLRSCHANMWSDDAVYVVHYILDAKPWLDEKSGASATDKTTHSWWWNEFHRTQLENRDIPGWHLITEQIPFVDVRSKEVHP